MHSNRPYTIYIASSFRHKHAVQMLTRLFTATLVDIAILDWTEKATPPEGLNADQRRQWMDTDHGGNVYSFCRDACGSADLVIYLGHSGQDAGVEVGMAFGSGVEVIGLAGPLESPGLMLHGAVKEWAKNIEDLIFMVHRRVLAHMQLNDFSYEGGGAC